MSNNSDIPYEFRASIFPDYVRIVTANAIISAQYVEKVFNGICLVLKPEGLRFSIEDFMSGDSARTRQTLGMIKRQLRKTNLFEQSFSDRLSYYTRRRNRVVHGLFADSFKSNDDIHIDSKKAQKYVKECEWVAEEGAQLVEVGFGFYRAVGEAFKRSYPDEPQLHDIVNGFDEFYELGLNCIARDLSGVGWGEE